MKRIAAILGLTLALQGAAVAEDTIKLGVVNIDSGPFAVSGAFVNDGATFAVESLNAQGGALGRKYELFIQNHDGKPPSAIVQATKAGEGKGEITLRSTIGRDVIEPPISPECKM